MPSVLARMAAGTSAARLNRAVLRLCRGLIPSAESRRASVFGKRASWPATREQPGGRNAEQAGARRFAAGRERADQGVQRGRQHDGPAAQAKEGAAVLLQYMPGAAPAPQERGRGMTSGPGESLVPQVRVWPTHLVIVSVLGQVRVRASCTAVTARSMSWPVVRWLTTEMRMARIPLKVVAPNHAWPSCFAQDLGAGRAPMPAVSRRAWSQQSSMIRAIPDRPRER